MIQSKCKIDTVEELLNSPDKEFIYCIYRLILKRDPDLDGYNYYLKKLASGTSKEKIISQLYFSKEADRHNLEVEWIKNIADSNHSQSSSLLKKIFTRKNISTTQTNSQKAIEPSEYRLNTIASNVKVSVIILTKNPGQIFKEVLESVLAQETDFSFEVIVIDSGSTDGTLEFIQKFEKVHLVKIKPEDFGHGKTRNLGVSLANGEYAALLTHDAKPKNNKWLSNLIAPLENDLEVAGVFGRHEAYPTSRQCTIRDIKQHFDGFLNWPSIVSLEDPQRYLNDQGYRQVLHFFSDNNACLRISIWKNIPYPEVDFAEDQLWAKAIIEAGYKKAYSDDAIVYHSHDYSIMDTFRRSFDESRALGKYFNYNLCPSFKYGVSQAKACTKSDISFLNNLNSRNSRSAKLEIKKVRYLHYAKQLGFYLGQHKGLFKNILFNVISLDNSIKKQGMTKNENIYSSESKKIKKNYHEINIDPKLFKNDLIGFYDFVLTKDMKSDLDVNKINKKTVAWLIPDFGFGSGGHLNIFRFVSFLEHNGYENTICIVGAHGHSSTDKAREKIRNYFFPINAKVVFGVNNLDPAYYSFATSWITAYALKGFSHAMHKLYFVQDFEPYFYAMGSEYYFAEETYKFGFTGVTAGSWLSKLLNTNYNMQCYDISFSYDKELYKQTIRRENHIRRIFCYVRPPTARRGFETAMLALNIVGSRFSDVEFIFAGWDMGNYYFPYPHLNGGILKVEELPDLFSQCDIGLVLSFTNLSLLPLELMSCGCVVVSNKGENNEWLLNEENCVLSESTPAQLAETIINLLENPEKMKKIRDKGLKFAKSTSWSKEGEKLINILKEVDASHE